MWSLGCSRAFAFAYKCSDQLVNFHQKYCWDLIEVESIGQCTENCYVNNEFFFYLDLFYHSSAIFCSVQRISLTLLYKFIPKILFFWMLLWMNFFFLISFLNCLLLTSSKTCVFILSCDIPELLLVLVDFCVYVHVMCILRDFLFTWLCHLWIKRDFLLSFQSEYLLPIFLDCTI